MPQELKLSQVRPDGGTQPRADIRNEVIDDYADTMTEKRLPPLIVFFDGKEYWLADGFHRYYAARKLEWKKVECDVRKGTVRDAQLFALGANQHHGLRRSREDKRSVCERIFEDQEWSQWSDHKIAEDFGINRAFVSNIRKEYETAKMATGSIEPVKTITGQSGQRLGKDGRMYSQPAKTKCPLCGSTDLDEDGDCMNCYNGAKKGVVPVQTAPAAQNGKAERHSRFPARTDAMNERRSPYKVLIATIRQVVSEAQELVEQPDHAHLKRTIHGVEAASRDMISALKTAMPVAVCPLCHGNGCEKCLHTKYITEQVYIMLTPAQQAQCVHAEEEVA